MKDKIRKVYKVHEYKFNPSNIEKTFELIKKVITRFIIHEPQYAKGSTKISILDDDFIQNKKTLVLEFE